jgi:glutamate-5-semialdehyde dehydrogenase
MTKDIRLMCEQARKASRPLALASESLKNSFLQILADWLIEYEDEILAANGQDVRKAAHDGLSDALIDRLTLTPERIHSISDDVRAVIGIKDPVGEVFGEQTLPNGLRLHKVRVPLGVVAVIYESRPNVTIDVAALALKSGNALILRGGSETINSNRMLVAGIHAAAREAGLDPAAIQFIDDPDRELVARLLRMHDYVDMLIPRGGAGLHAYCRENSRIPVITGGIGICHLFVDASADVPRSIKVIHNAKTQRPTVCNALDTVMVHRSLATTFIPMLVAEMRKAGVRMRVDSRILHGLGLEPAADLREAVEGDFDTEWLSLVLGIKVVDNLDEAIAHIAAHSTGHSDGILTADEENAKRFLHEVDSAVVYTNASTRFTDGAQLGLGAEVAVSTQRLHARGPMALRELTTYKWVVEGEYHIRD